MSSFGSSVINKSSKKYTPKAPARRNRPTVDPIPSSTVALPPSAQHDTAEQAKQPSVANPVPHATVPEPTVETPELSAPAVDQTLPTPPPPAINDTHEPATAASPPTSPKRTRASANTSYPPHKRRRVDNNVAHARTSPVPLPTPEATQASEPTTSSHERHESQPSQLAHDALQPTLSKRQAAVARAQAKKKARKEAEGKAAQIATEQVANAAADERMTRRDGAESGQHSSEATPRDMPGKKGSDSVRREDDQQHSRQPGRKSRATRSSVTEENRRNQAGLLGNINGHNEQISIEAIAEPAEPEHVDLTATGPATKTKRKRAANPRTRPRRNNAAGPEDHEIDATALSMMELSKDSRSGKTSGLESRMAQVDWAKVAAQRKAAETEALERAAAAQEAEQNGGTADSATTDNPAVQADNDAVDARLDRAAAAAESTHYSGPQLKLVDGQMVVDESTRAVDRYALNPEVDASGAALEEIEEDDITRRINSQSWLHASRRDPMERRISNKSDPWTPDQTASFYEALRMFGTDFYIISRMFAGKTRRHIKLKFNREERADPERIRAALLGGSVPMDMKVYEERTGRAAGYYKDPGILKQELAEADERQRAEIEKQKELEREAARLKMEAARERQEAAKKGRKGRKKGPLPAAGDGYEVSETAIDAGAS